MFERRVTHWFHRLDQFDDERLERLAVWYLILSRIAAGRPRSFYHRYVWVIYGEMMRRGLEDGWERAVDHVKAIKEV